MLPTKPQDLTMGKDKTVHFPLLEGKPSPSAHKVQLCVLPYDHVSAEQEQPEEIKKIQ